jgi:3',5'-cyclic AMP phosphodiesterase CpdA
LPLLVLPGNHDDRALLRQAMGTIAYPPPEGEFLHRVVDDLPVRIVALDTQVPGRPEGALCPRRLGWLADRLAEAPGRPTLIAMHHPPFVTGIGHMDAMRCFDDVALAKVLRSAPGVERLVCGHVHRPVTVRWAGMVASIAPSTAHQVALDLVEGAPARWTGEPPAIALHAWAPEIGFVSHLSYTGNFPATAFT